MSDARNQGETATLPLRMQPFAEIVRRLGASLLEEGGTSSSDSALASINLHVCVTLGVTGSRWIRFAAFFLQQGAIGVPEERWPTKTSSGTRVNVPAKQDTCCSCSGLLSWWFMYVGLVHFATLVCLCFEF